MKKKLMHAALGFFLLLGFATSGFAQWEKANWSATSSYFDLYINQSNIISRTWDTLNGDRSFLSSDNGLNWTQIETDSSKYVLSMVIVSDYIFAGTWNGLANTPVSSAIWNDLSPTGLAADSTIWSLEMINSTLYAGAEGTIYKSSGTLIEWTEIKSGIPESARITSFANIGNTVFAGSDTSGVFITTDAGSNWTAINSGLADRHISQLVTMSDKIYAVTLNGTFTSSNNGSSWTKINLENINCLVVADNKLYAGTDINGIFVSTDSFASWSPVATDIADDTRIFSMVANNDYLVTGTSDGVWRTPLSTIQTPVESNTTPEMYVLDGNYPNPFNPTTTIGFSTPVSGNVTLTIYNTNGQKIRTLVDNSMSSGAHKVVWDGLTDGGIRPPSGLYMYELRAGTFRDSKKLMLMK
ncbi:FlgD immunoglobulin-like domain containing protein [Candidatus Latescibacterota bacterium]